MKTTGMSEKELVGLIKAGDSKAFHIVMEKYYPLIKYVCFKFKIREQDIEDIKQEASLKIWEKRQDLDLELSFGSYLITIAKHLIYKKIKLQARLIFLEHYNSDQDTVIDSTSDQVNYNDLENHINTIIGHLPEQQGKIIKLKVLGSYSTDEIFVQIKKLQSEQPKTIITGDWKRFEIA
ncbi:MAG: sigma-70 family RNA polymerase sigma factor [Bacteroidales bacterium]|nr:sigma-70 family RNA polymerase sigma factor [Bacteroidales bacterium]